MIKEKILRWIMDGAINQDGLRRKMLMWTIIKGIEKMNNKSWQTTASGILTAIGLALTAVKDPAWLSLVGTVLAALGAGLNGMAGRDNNKTSEQVAAGPK